MRGRKAQCRHVPAKVEKPNLNIKHAKKDRETKSRKMENKVLHKGGGTRSESPSRKPRLGPGPRFSI